MICKRWYHPSLSGGDAKTLLMTNGFNGSFLVRPSVRTPGDYTLCTRSKDNVVNIAIQNNGDYYAIYDLEQFATLAELVQHYMDLKQPLPTLHGEPELQRVQLLRPLYATDPTSERWYHGNIPKGDAEALLLKELVNAFLVRESISLPGRFVLSVKTSDTDVLHILIETEAGKGFFFNGVNPFDSAYAPRFSTLTELVHYYRAEKFNVSGNWIELGQPVNSTRINVANIADRVNVLEKEMQGSSLRGTAQNKQGFNEEFHLLQQDDDKLLFAREAGQKAENKPKNRYKNILPYENFTQFLGKIGVLPVMGFPMKINIVVIIVDHSRVILKDGDPEKLDSDYINANYITIDADGCRRTAYIATQGCLPVTINDFWRMIWQENSCIIVNLTKQVEKGKNKCACYWTEEGQESRVFDIYSGRLVLSHQSRTQKEGYFVRRFQLERFHEKDEGELVSVGKKTVYQFHFTAWPDKSVPEDPGPLLDFSREVNFCYESLPSCGPITVHCSAGIGRTGAWLIVDILINDIRRNGLESEIDVQKTVQKVRAQRSGMVQTEGQYKFIYLATKHYIETARQRLAAQYNTPADQTESEYGNLYAEPLGITHHNPASESKYENVENKNPQRSTLKSTK